MRGVLFCAFTTITYSLTLQFDLCLQAKSLADDIIETNSPFRRYGGISSSFRSQLTALEAKKMITGSGSGPKVPTRPRSFASSEGDVNNKVRLLFNLQ